MCGVYGSEVNSLLRQEIANLNSDAQRAELIAILIESISSACIKNGHFLVIYHKLACSKRQIG
jgi:hypothetical protein